MARMVEPSSARRDRRDNDALVLLLASALSPESSAIDVGANTGRVLDDIVRLAPLGRHLAYEPIPDLHSDLVRRFPSVDVRLCALSDEAGESDFVHVTSHPGYSGLRERSYPGRETLEHLRVRTERLDDVLPDGLVPALIKVDVEGAEGGVFRGAAETLERHRPLVIFEHGKGAAQAYGTTPREIHGLLAERAGLRIFDLDGAGPYSLDEFEETFERGTRWNFFARS
jgi:FkbM family methyltransferase